VVRDIAAGERAAKDITATTGSTALHVAPLDLTDPVSIAAFTASWDGPLHILVNNAGVMACPEQYTAEGWESVRHQPSRPFRPGQRSAPGVGRGRRRAHRGGQLHRSPTSPVVFDDVNFAFRPYDPWLAYGQSITANVLFAVAATRRWSDDGITANALMPGAIYTNLQRHTGGRGSGKVPPELIKTPEQGAATSVLLATTPLLEGISGRYFVDCNETDTVDRRIGTLHGVARYALDPANAERLWTVRNPARRRAVTNRGPAKEDHDHCTESRFGHQGCSGPWPCPGRGLADHMTPADTVYLTGRDIDRVTQAVEAVPGNGARVRGELLDVADPEAASRLAARLRERHGASTSCSTTPSCGSARTMAPARSSTPAPRSTTSAPPGPAASSPAQTPPSGRAAQDRSATEASQRAVPCPPSRTARRR
jgi:NAD(P)-dependent dehydrogenase (short-subunit alcohol dehydrogenase family)